MKVNDPLRFIDWEIKKFLGVVLATQTAALVLIWLEMNGVHVPILRQFVCFLYLTFMPGALVLRALNVRKLGPIESTLFTVGASLAALMFMGALLNYIGPYFGLATPITLLPIMVMLAAFVLILSVVCYLRDRKAEGTALLDIKKALSPPALFLCILPFMAVFGAYLMNFFGTNVLLVLMILAIAAIVLLVGFDRLIPKEMYPLAIFVIALSLLLQNALISMYVNGWDIQYERYTAAIVLTNGFWDMSTFNILNAMLSIVMLAPIYSLITNMDIVWIFKIVYPLLFALVPLGLYEAFKKQANEKIAFMASFFFTSLVIFYTEMLQLARQEIAEIFLVIVILLIINHHMDKVKWCALFVMFSFSLVISHYGLTYIFITSLIVVWAMLYMDEKIHFKSLGKIGMNRRLSLALIIPIITFSLVWYIFTSSGNAFSTVVYILNNIIGHMTDFINPNKVQGMAIIANRGSVSALHKVYLYLMLFTQVCIVIGIAVVILKKELVKMDKGYFAFSLVMIALLFAGLSVPFVASALNTTRLYQISLIFLAIFLVIGWLGVSKLLGRLARRDNPGMPIAFRTLAIFLAIFLIFNTGLVFEIFNDTPISYSLNKSVDYPIFSYAELTGANWIMNERNATPIDKNHSSYYLPPIYCDSNRKLLFSGLGASQAGEIPADYSKILHNSYIYLGTYNLLNDKVMVVNTSGVLANGYYDDASALAKNRVRIYANGGAEIYH